MGFDKSLENYMRVKPVCKGKEPVNHCLITLHLHYSILEYAYQKYMPWNDC